MRESIFIINLLIIKKGQRNDVPRLKFRLDIVKSPALFSGIPKAFLIDD